MFEEGEPRRSLLFCCRSSTSFGKKRLWGTPEAVRYRTIRPLPFELDRNESRAFRRAGSFAMRHFDSAFAIYGVLALCLIAGGNAPLASRIVPG